MSATGVVVVAAVWFAIGLVLSLVLGRRGHDGYSWFLLGVVLGPLAVVFAVEAWRHYERPAHRPLVAADGGRDRGTVDVLVGFDGSTGSQAALAAAIELLGARLGRLTLATVIPYEGGREGERDAAAALHEQTERLNPVVPGLKVIRGHPAKALAAEALEGGYGLLAIGTKGAGHAHLFGSAATELARTSKLPVLLAGAADRPG